MLGKIKSLYILRKIFKYVHERVYLNIINYNKNIQKKLNISIDTYIKYFNQIEIEIIVDNNKLKNKENKFININDEKYKSFYHIYLDNSKKEINRNYIMKNEIIAKIKVIIDMEIKSLSKLFNECLYVKEIKFIRFNRIDFTDFSYMFNYSKDLINIDISKIKTDNIENMKNMFSSCSSLKSLNLTNFKTDKVKNISYMFFDCTLLEDLDLSNFKTSNLIEMSCMFSFCESLKELNLSNFLADKLTKMERIFQGCTSLIYLNMIKFKTDNVIRMDHMFYDCLSIEKLDLSHFKTDKVENMKLMFHRCEALKELNLSNFIFNNSNNVENMFSGCSEELKNKIKEQYKNIKENAFNDFEKDDSDPGTDTGSLDSFQYDSFDEVE